MASASVAITARIVENFVRSARAMPNSKGKWMNSHKKWSRAVANDSGLLVPDKIPRHIRDAVREKYKGAVKTVNYISLTSGNVCEHSRCLSTSCFGLSVLIEATDTKDYSELCNDHFQQVYSALVREQSELASKMTIEALTLYGQELKMIEAGREDDEQILTMIKRYT